MRSGGDCKIDERREQASRACRVRGCEDAKVRRCEGCERGQAALSTHSAVEAPADPAA